MLTNADICLVLDKYEVSFNITGNPEEVRQALNFLCDDVAPVSLSSQEGEGYIYPDPQFTPALNQSQSVQDHCCKGDNTGAYAGGDYQG